MHRIKAPSGFFHLEILVAVAVIAILMAIAIPQIMGTRKRNARDENARLAVLAMVDAQEAHRKAHAKYLPCDSAEDCKEKLSPIPADVFDGFDLRVLMDAGGDHRCYLIRGSHPEGTGKAFIYDNCRGGMDTTS